MSSTTTHLGFVKPVGADGVSALRTSIGSNADIADAALGRVSGALQEGVIDAGSFEVTQDTGSNMNVKVASHVGTGAYVQDDGVTGQGLYYVVTTASVTTAAIGAAHATLPRVDRVVVGLDGTVAVVAGTATSGATLDNLTGAAGVPASKLLLADVLIPATDTTISNSQIRDRRKWARGVYCRKIITDNHLLTTNPTSFTLVDATNLNPRIECSGVPLRARLISTLTPPSSAIEVDVDLGIDGVAQGLAVKNVSSSGTLRVAVHYEWVLTPSAGSHKLGPMGRVSSASGFYGFYNDTVNPLVFLVEEMIRQDTANNVTTTG